jgi:hypothetical protein
MKMYDIILTRATSQSNVSRIASLTYFPDIACETLKSLADRWYIEITRVLKQNKKMIYVTNEQ